MVVSRYLLSRRDIVLLLIGATFTHIAYFLRPPLQQSQISTSFHVEVETKQSEFQVEKPRLVPHTTILEHAPGYTLFQNLYVSNGTLFIVSTEPQSSFPARRMMISTSIFAEATPENIAAREPTSDLLDFISPQEARSRWDNGNRVFTVDGNTVLFNDPSQFLRHYYHFVAELWFGAYAFWHGAFSSPIPETIPDSARSSNQNAQNWNAYPDDTQGRHPSSYTLSHHEPPNIDRAIFMHSNADGWRDHPGFNAYFQRAAFPGMSVEHEEDWNDRIASTDSVPYSNTDRAFFFPLALLVDRSATFRDDMTGSHTQRTAAQAWEGMRKKGKLRGERVGGWWEPVRDRVLRFAGVRNSDNDDYSASTDVPLPSRPTVTYISRQGGSRRKLTSQSHQSLVNALNDLRDRFSSTRLGSADETGFELNIVEAEKLTKDEQLAVIGRTTILLGVHGNGLTHLVFMPPTRYSTVIEMFYPGGFAHDYHWTARALGMKHYAVWNDTFYTHPNEPLVDYPDGFQEDYVPVHGPTVARIIEERLQGRVPQE